MYLLLRENVSVQANLVTDSRLTLPLQERCSVLCWLPKYLVCGYSLVVVGILLFQVFRGERIAQSCPWGILDSRNSWFPYGCCSWSKWWVQGCCFSISSSLISVAFFCFVLHYLIIFRILGLFAVFGNITASWSTGEKNSFWNRNSGIIQSEWKKTSQTPWYGEHAPASIILMYVLIMRDY